MIVDDLCRVNFHFTRFLALSPKDPRELMQGQVLLVELNRRFVLNLFHLERESPSAIMFDFKFLPGIKLSRLINISVSIISSLLLLVWWLRDICYDCKWMMY